MSRFTAFLRLPTLAFAIAASAILSGCVVAPIGPRPVVIRPVPIYVEPAAVVVLQPPPPRAYYWHRSPRYWRY